MRIFPITKERYLWGALARAPYGALLPWSFCQQYSSFSKERSSLDSCIISNGIPRSGTYLVNNILRTLGGWENIGVHINPKMWDTWQRDDKVTIYPCLAHFAVRKIQNGQLVGAHLPWTKELEQTLGQETRSRRIKHVLIHRDPRDTFLSYLNWTTYSSRFLTTAGGNEFRRFMLESFEDDDQRISYIIKQTAHNHTAYMGYAPWLTSPNCLTLKFEDLYPEIDDLDSGVVGPLLTELFCYSDINIGKVDLADFRNKVYGQSTTEIGQYKNVFKDEHYSYLDNPEFRSTLRTFGYEW